jgi:ABC-type uncharacterized transport system permease subunit
VTDFAVVSSLVLVTTPLLLAATGEWIAERAGVINIAVEGAMLVSCYAAFACGLATGDPYLAALVAAIAGAGFALLLALFAVILEVDAVVAGTALNLLALGATAVAFRRHGAGTASTLPGLPPHLLPAVAFVLLPLLGIAMHRSRLGLALRACGEGASAAATQGVPVDRIRVCAVAAGGLLAGLGGAQLALVEARTFVEGMTGGRGFLALAIVVCGRWRAGGVLVAALFFGGAIVLQFQFQAGGSRVPYPVFLMLPYVLTLCVLAGVVTKARAPADLNRAADESP